MTLPFIQKHLRRTVATTVALPAINPEFQFDWTSALFGPATDLAQIDNLKVTVAAESILEPSSCALLDLVAG